MTTIGASQDEEGLEVAVHLHEDSALVQVLGNVDAENAHRVDEALQRLAEQGIRRFTIDLTDVRLMDEAGLRPLVRLVVERPHCAVSVAETPPNVRSMLELTGLDEHVRLL